MFIILIHFVNCLLYFLGSLLDLDFVVKGGVIWEGIFNLFHPQTNVQNHFNFLFTFWMVEFCHAPRQNISLFFHRSKNILDWPNYFGRVLQLILDRFKLDFVDQFLWLFWTRTKRFVPITIQNHFGLLCCWHVIRKAIWWYLEVRNIEYSLIFKQLSVPCLPVSVLYVEKN